MISRCSPSDIITVFQRNRVIRTDYNIFAKLCVTAMPISGKMEVQADAGRSFAGTEKKTY